MRALRAIRLAIIILFVFLAAYPAATQPYFRIYCRHITPKTGLSSIYVRKIIQDPYGYMWIGTQDGLNRYDGKNFTVYNRGAAPTQALAGVDIRDLLLDTVHHLVWAISSFGGIDAIDYITGNSVYSYRQNENHLTADIVFNSLALDGNRLYLGSTSGLYVLRTENYKLERAQLNYPTGAVLTGSAPAGMSPVAPSIDKLFKDPTGRLWLFCRDQILLLRDSTLTVCATVLRKSLLATPGIPLHFYDCTLLHDGTILAATTFGLKTFSCRINCLPLIDNNPFPAVPWSAGHEVYSCREDGQGNIWFSIAGYLIRSAPSAASNNATSSPTAEPRPTTFTLVREHTSHDEPGWLDAVYNICFDKDNDVWLGCQAGLAYAANRPSCFTSITVSSKSATAIRHAYALVPVNDSLLYCSAQEGLYKVNPMSADIIPLDRNIPYYQAFPDPYHRLLVANINGPFILQTGRHIPLAQVYSEFRRLHNPILSSHCYSGDSVIAFGTQNEFGVILWNYRDHTVRTVDTHTPDLRLPEGKVGNLYTDCHGDIWVLGDKSVSVLDLKYHAVRPVDTHNPDSKQFYSLFFDVCEARGYYYLAAYGFGVIVLDSARRFVREISVKDGLCANSVYKVIPYKDSLLFVTSNNGISVIDLTRRYAMRNYYESDGLQSDNFEEYSGASYHDSIFVGGANGFTIIDPSRFTKSAPAPIVYVRRIRLESADAIKDTANLCMTALDIPANTQQTTIYFSSINYQNPDHSHLFYRLKELKAGWIDIGSQDFIPLIDPKPGKFTLQVRSMSKDGLIGPQLLELALQVRPHWFQTWWFMVLLILMGIAIVYALFLYRFYQLKEQQQIRKEIAGDLHDDFGSTLTTVQIFTHLARREHREEYFARIEESLAQANAGLRDMIWVLDESEDTIRELVSRITKFADPVSKAKDICFECKMDDDVAEREVSKTAKRNLLLIAKETINNSLKYSGCTHIVLEIAEYNNRLWIIIADDGCGFDVSKIHSGNGLRNIHERAKQIGFVAAITSSVQGTKLVIHGR